MTDDPYYIDPERAVGAFLAGCREALDVHLDVHDDGLAPGHSIEVIDVMAALAEVVKFRTIDLRIPDELLLRRLAMATLDLLGTAFTRTAEDEEIVQTWRGAFAEVQGAAR